MTRKGNVQSSDFSSGTTVVNHNYEVSMTVSGRSSAEVH